MPPAQQPPELNPAVSSLMRPLDPQNQQAINQNVVQGSLISFPYKYFKTDPYPLVIVTGLTPGKSVRGVNLHNLTFNNIRDLLSKHADQPGLNWEQMKQHSYITTIDAFRYYKWNGVDWSRLRKLDAQFIVQVANMVRSVDPNQVRAIKQTIREQMQQQMNPSAEELSGTTQMQQQQMLPPPTL